MKSFLLDTHIWIWSLIAPEHLNEKIKKQLEGENELWLSPVSVWETLVLIERKRIEVNLPKDQWVRKALEAKGMQEAPLNNEIAIESRSFRNKHQDPADRFIAATAKVYSLTLITSDKKLASFDGIQSLLN